MSSTTMQGQATLIGNQSKQLTFHLPSHQVWIQPCGTTPRAKFCLIKRETDLVGLEREREIVG